MGYVFISYSSKNMGLADTMRTMLHNNHISTWMAPYDIPAGSEYAEVLYDALTGCSCLVLLLTNDSQNSLWVKKEVNLAITNCKPLIPLMLEKMELNSAMKLYLNDQQIVAVPALNESAADIRKILARIIAFAGQNQPEPTPIPDPIPDPIPEVIPEAVPDPAQDVQTVDAPSAQASVRLEYPDGVYEGEYANGMRHGHGKFTWKWGSVYEGEYQNDKRHGKGKYYRIAPDHRIYYLYEGDFCNNERTGHAKITYSNGNTYEGDVFDGQRHGTGVFTWYAKPVPSALSGASEDNPVHKWCVGDVYKGTFAYNKIKSGKIYDKTGKLRAVYINGIRRFSE